MGAGVIKQAAETGGNHRRRRRRAQPMAEINVTPFVDVMLVLLIIFMVAAPLMTVGVPVELPKTAANALPTDDEEPLTVTITAEGLVMIQNTEVPEAELERRLVDRWLLHGLGPDAARARATGNDIPNAQRVARRSAAADITMR